MISAAICLSLVAIAAPTEQPNVVVFLVDDLGWADLSCYGSTYHETPHIDELAKAGMKFTNAYAAASLCSPTRASILTGKHPVRVNITDWIPGAGDQGRKLKTPEDVHNLPLAEHTLGEAFRDSGYQTFYAGKWHLGDPDHGPDKQGFNTYVQTATRQVNPDGKSKRTRIAIPQGDRWHLTRFITEKTVEYISGYQSAQPFFIFVSYHDVHSPVLADDRFVAKFESKSETKNRKSPKREGDGKTRMVQNNPKYASMVRGMDQSVGDILRALDDADLLKNTIILFASDNGGLSTLKRPGPTCNLPLRAGKGWLYEGGIRIPLIVSYPGHIRPDSKTEQMVVTTDYYPTLLELAKIPLATDQHVDGKSFSKTLLEKTADQSVRDLYWHFPHYHGSRWTPGSAVRSGDWKLIHFYEHRRYELYNLRDDPGELQDLADRTVEKLDEMKAKLNKWRDDLRAQAPVFR